jgi:ubiquitin-like-conjugating enzyme ATG3
MKSAFFALREALTPAMQGSRFLEGFLTPAEFVVACDALIQSFPTFKWARVLQMKNCLPADKQCIVMRDVISRRRIADAEKNEVAEVNDGEEGLVIGTMATAGGDEYDDIDNYVDHQVNAVEGLDIGTVTNTVVPPKVASSDRFYDMWIIYDVYYACPRTYLVGRDNTGLNLVPDAMFEDIMQDYVNKTATLERHPYYPDTLTVSIHPCRHTQTMKTLLAASKTPQVESYMMAFLKMMASMLPTLEYDYTGSVATGKSY